MLIPNLNWYKKGSGKTSIFKRTHMYIHITFYKL